MVRTSGWKNSERRNSDAVTRLVSPVRPPAAMPAPLSIYAVTVDVPSVAPATVPDGIGQQRLARAGQRAVAHQPGLLADADERADRIEQREEEKHENDGGHAGREGAADIELHERGRERGRRARDSLVVNDAKRHAERRACQNAPEESAGHAARHQHRRQRQGGDRDHSRGQAQIAQRHERAWRRDDESRPLQPDGGDQQPDAGRNRVLQRRRESP